MEQLMKIKQIKYFIYGVLISFLISLIIWPIYNVNPLVSLRVIFGFFFVMYLPGYIATHYFFKNKDSDWVEITAISMGLSLALVVLTIIITNLVFKIPITALTNFLVILALILVIWLLGINKKNIKNYFSKLKKKLFK